jgi:hypothetical protein
MPTLSASNSIFQLAVGVNAVLPILVSDYEGMRDRAAESMLRKIRELYPRFEIKERDREEFISFMLRSTNGLRHAQRLTHSVALLSTMLSAISLAALCWAAIEPDWGISVKQLFTFVGATLIAGPAFYAATNRHLKWIYSILAKHSSNEAADTKLFADILESYLAFQKRWEPYETTMDELLASVPFMIWRMRFSGFNMSVRRIWSKIRYKLRL